MQLLSLAFLFFSPTMMFLMLPFATSGFVVVIFVIYCGYGEGSEEGSYLRFKNFCITQL